MPASKSVSHAEQRRSAAMPPSLPPPIPGSTPDFEDPLASILGPGANAQLLGKPDDEIPDEIVAIFQEHGLGERKFRVLLKQIPEGSNDDGNLPFIKSWTRCIPSLDYIGREYGPGQYKLIFTWLIKENGKMTQHTDNMVLTISDRFLGEYKKFQFEKKIAEVENRRNKVQDMKLDGTIDASLDPLLTGPKKEDVPIEEAAIKYVDNITNVAAKLGLTRSGGGGIDWDKIIALASIAVPALLNSMSASRERAAQESQRFLTMMMGIMTQNNQQLVEVMKTHQSPKGADLTKEMFDMIRGAIDVKEMIADHGKESLSDRIFNLLTTLGPQILDVAKMSAMQRRADPRVQAARMYVASDKDMQAAARDPHVAAELYVKVDEVFGWKQADIVLGEVGGVPRPAECPRRPEQELPIDQRNAGVPDVGTTESVARTAPTEDAEFENVMGGSEQ